MHVIQLKLYCMFPHILRPATNFVLLLLLVFFFEILLLVLPLHCFAFRRKGRLS
jgi:hypothetical protein